MGGNLPKRKDIRLKSWDYSSAACYHVTICAKGRLPLFGTVVERQGDLECDVRAHVVLSDIGECCLRALELAERTYEGFDIDAFVIMPNHIHLLVKVEEHAPRGGISSFVSYFKGNATRNARKIYPGCDIWQARFYDHVIRDERDYRTTVEYIENNPAKWREDEYWAEG